MEEATTPRGALYAALDRSHEMIRAERADAIKESARLAYRRRIEDLNVTVKGLERAQSDVLDLAGDSTFNIINSKKFDAEGFVATNAANAIALKDTREKLAVLVSDYERLFGVKPNLEL